MKAQGPQALLWCQISCLGLELLLPLRPSTVVSVFYSDRNHLWGLDLSVGEKGTILLGTLGLQGEGCALVASLMGPLLAGGVSEVRKWIPPGICLEFKGSQSHSKVHTWLSEKPACVDWPA